MDDSFTLMQGYEYYEFGNKTVTGDAGFLNEVTFTGLYYMNTGLYNPNTGCFLTQDSYKGNAYEPWSQHLYSYTGNNPINYVDPTGHRFTANLTDTRTGGRGGNNVVLGSEELYVYEETGELPAPPTTMNSMINEENELGKTLLIDEAGLRILGHYFYGLGAELWLYNDFWTSYMRDDVFLTEKLTRMISGYSSNMINNSISYVKETTNITIVDGEGISGRQFLHGTNAEVGGFQYFGEIIKDINGNVTANMLFVWNDKIDAKIINGKKISLLELMKVGVAKVITQGAATNYSIHIVWDQSFEIPGN